MTTIRKLVSWIAREWRKVTGSVLFLLLLPLLILDLRSRPPLPVSYWVCLALFILPFGGAIFLPASLSLLAAWFLRRDLSSGLVENWGWERRLRAWLKRHPRKPRALGSTRSESPQADPGPTIPPASAQAEFSQPKVIPLRLVVHVPGQGPVPLEHLASHFPEGTQFHVQGLQQPPSMRALPKPAQPAPAALLPDSPGAAQSRTAADKNSTSPVDSSMMTPRRIDLRRPVIFLWLVLIAGTTLWAPFKLLDGRGHVLGPAPRQPLLFAKNETDYMGRDTNIVALDFQRLFAEWVAISAAGGALLVLAQARH